MLDCQARGDDLEWQSRVGGQSNSGGLNHHDDGNGTDCGGDNDEPVGVMGSGTQDIGMAKFQALAAKPQTAAESQPPIGPFKP